MINNTIKTKSHVLWLALFIAIFINACTILSDEADLVKIDTASPALTNIYTSSILKQNIPGEIIFTFNKSVKEFITNDIELSGVNIDKGKFVANSKKKYTWKLTPREKGKLYISIPVGSFEDLAGNTNTNSISTNFTIEKDIVPPTVSITGLFNLANNIRGQVIFSFSEDVTNFTKSDVRFSDPPPEVGDFRINNKKSYELIITPEAAGTLTVSIDANSFEDLAGNSNKAISAGLTVDTSKPEVDLKEVIEAGRIPVERSTLKGIAKDVASYYNTNEASPAVVAKYVKVNGDGDGSFWNKATNDVKATINSISNASDSKIYIVLVASGKYPSDRIAMKNHVSIIGGWDPNADWKRKSVTQFYGQGNNKSVFSNFGNLDHTALLYSAIITNGNVNRGGGMYNEQSSPSLHNVTFSGNKATDGGGIYNKQSSPSLHNVTFSRNSVTRGGGMYNEQSSPSLHNVTFLGNTATMGGGVYNEKSSPSLHNVTFSRNTANSGGGMYNEESSPILINVTLSGNTATMGGGMINNTKSSPILINATFSGNKAGGEGGGMYGYNTSSGLLVNTIFWGNIADRAANQISFSNATEKLSLHYSIIEGGTNNLSKFLTSSHTTNSDPSLSAALAGSNSFVQTHALGSGSHAINKGVYVKKFGKNLYFSKDNQNWYTEFDNNGLKTTATLPNDAEDITATDARGYKRVKQPDIGAYEYGATDP